MTVIEQAFVGVNKIHDATPVEGRPGFYRGWLKLTPSIGADDSAGMCRIEYQHGEWSSLVYQIATEAK